MLSVKALENGGVFVNVCPACLILKALSRIFSAPSDAQKCFGPRLHIEHLSACGRCQIDILNTRYILKFIQYYKSTI